ncbi:type III-B CRISPR module-associated protein Cmr3 [Clostridium fermenticellae]|uniref:Type III-B CRISPR module-associated protein Cmr3 n=1 Tax=Clostridium fermenticellae TaxID=2068654 RepID=A0A386H3Z1_9CLOT|nr:type III-B CRISPR module-associated Cmr3 family protein [Clostridium fermenticellae]AYD40243.1 type III-B CRISPR module-associated protein Cmr3 [Clostridium fermenticellae]
MSSKKIMKIKPCDNLFLGTGKQFIKEESTWLSTRLIPYPSVFQGAIASLMLAKNRNKRKKYIDEDDYLSDPRNYLKIGRIYLYNDKDREVYMSAPLDLFLDEYGKCHFLNIKRIDTNIICSVEGVSHLFFNEISGDSERVDGMFIKYRNFYNSYCYTQESIVVIKPSDIVSDSYKVGIQLNENHTTKEGHLYRIDLTEFKEDDEESWSYLVEYAMDDSWWDGETNQLEKGYLKLGGENKACKFWCYDIEKLLRDYSNIYNKINENEYVKILLTTPCEFKSGNWKPEFKNIEVVAAAIGKGYDIGGFDMKLKIPKPMNKAVPEGSIYILRGSDLKGKCLGEIRKIIEEENILKEETKIRLNGFSWFEVISISELQMQEVGEG